MITLKKTSIDKHARMRAANDAILVDILADVLMARHLDPGNIIKHIKAAEAKCHRKKDRLTFVRIRKSPNPIAMLDKAAADFDVLIDEVTQRYVPQDAIDEVKQYKHIRNPHGNRD